MSDSAALIARQEAAIVRAAGDVVEALREYQKIQAGLDQVMPDCIIRVQGRPFRKKQYWRAIATGFNLSVSATREEKVVLENDWGFQVTYTAAAPNGRTADGDGSCFASEKFGAGKTIHNVRSHAHTRAFNRAVSNLVGFGEVSAEEVERDQHHGEPEEPGSHDGPPSSLSGVISEPQRKRLFAISKKAQARMSITDDAMTAVVKAIAKKYGFTSSKDITRDKYEAICNEVEHYDEPPDGE